jgi:outer membrane biosynthesis protein TonB
VFARSFKVSLLISALIHFGAVAAINQDVIAKKILANPPSVPVAKMKKSEPKTVQFELVYTPASARVATPQKNTGLMSDKNTRAQDTFKSEKRLPDSPHMEGNSNKAKDTRQQMIVRQTKTPPTEQRMSQKSVKEARLDKNRPRQETREKPEKEMTGKAATPEKAQPETRERIEIAHEPEKKELIQLAKKAASPDEPAIAVPPPMAPRVITAASTRDTEADARITGELSFGATRHFFGEYLLKMKQAVERQWVSRLVSRYTGIVSSRAVIDFKIQPDGHVTDIVVNSNEGDPYFPLVCVSSISDAQPFDKIPYDEAPGLPEQYTNKPLSIRFTFQYN